MMQFSCIHCQQALSLKDTLAGRIMECPACQTVLLTPPQMPDVLDEFVRQFSETFPDECLSSWIPAQRMVTQGVLCLTTQPENRRRSDNIALYVKEVKNKISASIKTHCSQKEQ